MISAYPLITSPPLFLLSVHSVISHSPQTPLFLIWWGEARLFLLSASLFSVASPSVCPSTPPSVPLQRRDSAAWQWSHSSFSGYIPPFSLLVPRPKKNPKKPKPLKLKVKRGLVGIKMSFVCRLFSCRMLLCFWLHCVWHFNKSNPAFPVQVNCAI